MPHLAAHSGSDSGGDNKRENEEVKMVNNYKRILKVKRVQRGIDRDKDFAELIGWTGANYHNRMANSDNLKVRDLEKMADVLNCDLKIDFIDRK